MKIKKYEKKDLLVHFAVLWKEYSNLILATLFLQGFVYFGVF